MTTPAPPPTPKRLKWRPLPRFFLWLRRNSLNLALWFITLTILAFPEEL